MITVLARFEIQKGKEMETVAAVEKMAAAVKAQEPGCLVYMVNRGQVNVQEIYMYEIYADQDSFDAHRKTDHMRELQKAFDDCLDRSSFNVEVLNTTAGFVRPEAAS